MLIAYVLISVSTVSLSSPLPPVHKPYSKSQWRHLFIFPPFYCVLFPWENISFHTDSLARITAKGPNCFSDTSVSHHQHLPTVWRQSVGSTILTLKVSHSGEMRHNKPFHRILIPDRTFRVLVATLTSNLPFMPSRKTATCHICKLVAFSILLTRCITLRLKDHPVVPPCCDGLFCSSNFNICHFAV